MKNIEEFCLNKLNTLLSKFNLRIATIKDKQLNLCQYKLIYKNNTDNELALWLSIPDILFNHIISLYKSDSIFICLASYHKVMASPTFNNLIMNKETLSMYQDCSVAYEEITSLKFDSFEEFIIKCDLMGI